MHLELLRSLEAETVDDWNVPPLGDALERALREPTLAAELETLRREKETLLTELAIARRWVEILAHEVETLDAQLGQARSA